MTASLVFASSDIPDSAHEAWGGFLADVRSAARRLGPEGGEEIFFRGHSNNQWPLLPGLLRGGLKNKELTNLEADLFFEFQSQARDLPSGHRDDWDILFAMQHHGTPTRLLDWTDTFGAAVYFAASGARADGPMPCVWLLDAYGLNEQSIKKSGGRDLIAPKNLGWNRNEGVYYDYGELLLEREPIDWELPLAVYPSRRNPRMVAQRGYFTIHGSNPKALEKSGAQFVEKVELPLEALPAAHEFLEMAGITEATAFPDLDGLSRWLRKRYKV